MASPQIIPPIGLGTCRLHDQAVIDSVKSALALGYRHIDTAAIYENEQAVGKALRESGLPREKLFVTTKVWYESLVSDQLIKSIRASLQRLDLEWLDLVLIHWPSPGGQVSMKDYIGALDRAREKGLTRYIGVSNFTIAQVDQALASPGGNHLVTNQIEVHPYMANRKVVEHCQNKGLDVTGYMPLALGKVVQDPVLTEIGKTHNASPAQIALAWVAQRGIAVIPSSTRPEHQKANLEAVKLKLSEDEMRRIGALDKGERIVSPAHAPHWDG